MPEIRLSIAFWGVALADPSHDRAGHAKGLFKGVKARAVATPHCIQRQGQAIPVCGEL